MSPFELAAAAASCAVLLAQPAPESLAARQDPDFILSHSAGLELVGLEANDLRWVKGELSLMYRLAWRAADSNLSDDRREKLDQRFQVLDDAIDRRARAALFMGIRYLCHWQGVFVRSPRNSELVLVATYDVTSATLGIDGLDILTQCNATAAFSALQPAVESVCTDLERSRTDLVDLGGTAGCGSPAKACPGSVNSTGMPALLELWRPCRSVALGQLQLDISDCPPDVVGTVYYGTHASPWPMGSGLLCVGRGDGGAWRFPGIVHTSSQGSGWLQLDLDQLPQGVQIIPGSTWYFQFVHRDHGAAGPGTSQAIGLRFCP